jgi:hypothetical protein
LRTLRLHLAIFTLASFTTFYACNKYNDTLTPSRDLPEDKVVTASVQGKVLDENGLPVQGAAVTSGTASTTTDINGTFSFSGIQLSSRFGYVKVTRTGYFTGSRSIITSTANSSFISIQLIPRSSKGSFTASSGGAIKVQTGDTALFPAGAVVNAATSASYTGDVNVYATYIDPASTDLYKKMPGDMRGIGTDGKETLLKTFGIVAIEMEGSAGEKLQLAAGKKATLTWDIPSALQATAPNTLPLWYFDDATGKWMEEGTVSRVGNNYVGQVGHFTYWNIGLPMGYVNYKVRLKDQNGNAMAYTYVYFKTQGAYASPGNYTDSSGVAQGLIPAGGQLLFQVVSDCGNVLAGANVGPALTDQDLGTITVDVDHVALSITGNVVNCANDPVDSGFVNAVIDGVNYRATIRNGTFALPVSRCFTTSTEIKLTAYDLVALKQSSVKTVTASSGSVDAGELSICDAAAGEFFTFSYNGANRTFTRPTDAVTYSYAEQYSTYSITAYQIEDGHPVNGTVDMYLKNVTGPGNYPIYQFDYTDPNGINMTGVGATCTVTSFDDYFAGSLSGNLRNDYAIPNPTLLPISGQFRVRRTN